MIDILDRRRDEQSHAIAAARAYVEELSGRIAVSAAAVVGSIARGDFNLWSDVDVIVLCPSLPDRLPDRMELLADTSSRGIQPVGFTPSEFRHALSKRNRLALAVFDEGVILVGEGSFRGLRAG